MNSKKKFIGFGFGAIQSGLFLFEAFRSGQFDRLTVAEVRQDVVDAVRRADGRYQVNVAATDGIHVHEISGVEMVNPQAEADRETLLNALIEADEIATALPSVAFFDRGKPSVAGWLTAAFRERLRRGQNRPVVIYTAENNNHAAETLQQIVFQALKKEERDTLANSVQFLNTVIGKMSGVVTDETQIREDRLAPVTPGAVSAFLVEEFNRILITRITLPGFRRGIEVFQEKDDLMPFEEAKLYGHNATHALLGFLGHRRGHRFMSDVAQDADLMALAREAFIEESGAALIKRHSGIDPLFTPDGYIAYADDLLIRMGNPWLRDQVERVIRDPRRKLGWDDRLVGTIRLALAAGIRPRRYAQGVAAALDYLRSQEPGLDIEKELRNLWPDGEKLITYLKSEFPLVYV